MSKEEPFNCVLPEWFIEELSNKDKFRVPDEILASEFAPPRQFVRVLSKTIEEVGPRVVTTYTIETTEDWDEMIELLAREGQL